MLQVDIEKFWLGEYWSNRYIISATDVLAGSVIGAAIVAAERAVHLSMVQFTKYRCSDMVTGTDNFMTIPLGVPGLRGADTAALPLFCVARVDFSSQSGRPSRKFLRLPIQEVEQENGALVPTCIAMLNTLYVQPLVDLETFVGPQGENLTYGAVYPQVAMRQLRRGSKRKLVPIIP